MKKREPWSLRRTTYAGVAALALVLGVVGLFLPVMPTVPFMLVAAWAASKGSPRIHQWLYSHSHVGPMLTAWDTHGAIPRRGKWFAFISMTGSWILMFLLELAWWVLAIMAALFIAIAIFIATRPDG